MSMSKTDFDRFLYFLDLEIVYREDEEGKYAQVYNCDRDRDCFGLICTIDDGLVYENQNKVIYEIKRLLRS